MKTALYRHFSASGCLLYVGIASDLMSRLSGHEKKSPWFYVVASVSVEWFISRECALAAEKMAIVDESPRHNVMHACHADGTKKRRPGIKKMWVVTAQQKWLVERVKSSYGNKQGLVEVCSGAGINYETLRRLMSPAPVRESTLAKVMQYFETLDRAEKKRKEQA